jgi:hypothetical protein
MSVFDKNLPEESGRFLSMNKKQFRVEQTTWALKQAVLDIPLPNSLGPRP